MIEESLRLKVRLDIRLLVDKSFPDYIQHREGHSDTHWKDLIRTTLMEQSMPLEHTEAEAPTRKEKKMKEHDIIRQLLAEFSDRGQRATAWKERTGKSERAFYRRLREVGE